MMTAERKGTVLVVEDNPAMNNAICDILDLNGYQVLSAANGSEAVDLLESERPDVVLCDIMMPRMDGYALLRYTRAETRLKTLPFIFLTARSAPEDKRQAKAIGIEDYLVKPVDPEDLVLAVDNALRRAHNLAAETQSQLDALRGQIVRTLQHEFRTPLTFILGYAEYLAEVADEEIDLSTLQVSVDAILEGGHRLQDLVEKFLMLSDIQFRQSLPNQALILEPDQILLDVARAMETPATRASMVLVLDPDEAEDFIAGDPKYLHEALMHLVENAIQYRRPESKHVWLSVVSGKDFVGLRVADESRGISPETLDRLKQPFEQHDRDERTMPGAGLSLALIQHIARLHGGYLSMESELGVGSTFTLWLPKPTTERDEAQGFQET